MSFNQEEKVEYGSRCVGFYPTTDTMMWHTLTTKPYTYIANPV